MERSPVGTWAHYKDWTVVQRVAHLGMESSGEVAFSAGLVRHARTRKHPSLTLFHPPAVHIIPNLSTASSVLFLVLCICMCIFTDHQSIFSFIFHLYKKYIVYIG